jgi:tetratricopeptide (TPR) repeat protein
MMRMIFSNPSALFRRHFSRRAQALALLLGVGAALASVGGLHSGLRGRAAWDGAARLDDAQREAVNSSAFATILGELRTTAADLMWVKTERYMHRGVGFAPHLDAKALAHGGESDHDHDHAANRDNDYDHESENGGRPDPEQEGDGHVHDEHCDHDHENMAALIPDHAGDYRGYIGDLHRAVQPWQDRDAPHAHQPGDELLPWYRLLTFSNPHHERGYITGAWWLLTQARAGKGDFEETLAFIDEGVANNPKSFQIALMRGRILLAMDRDEEAVAAFRHSAELALAIRPEGGAPHPPEWTDWEEEDYLAAVHYVPAILLQKIGDARRAALALDWAEGLLPGDKRLASLRAGKF